MGFLDSKLYLILDNMANFLLLNLLWVLFCIPIITIFPSTAALFAVVRDSHKNKNKNVLQPFLCYFRKNFKRSLALSFIWAPAFVILYFNIQILDPLTSVFDFLLMVLIGIVILGFLYTSLYLFPVIVHFELPFKFVIKNAFFIAVSQLKYTLLGLGVLLFTAFLVYQFPVMILFISSYSAYIIYLTCYSAFEKVGAAY